jgi:hypothetical protein
MRFEDCRLGMEVIFGRGNGEQTRGVIVKINRAKAKVQTNENRGRTQAGTVWSVPYSLMEPANANVPAGMRAVALPIAYSPFQNFVEVKILEAINGIYSSLSPENLTCDGELEPTLVNQRRTKLNNQLKFLCQALGREVNETTAYQWQMDRETYEKDRTGTNG